MSDVCLGGCRGKPLLILCPRLLFVPQRRAPESEGPCAGATDAVKVLPFTMLTPLLDVSNPAHVSPPLPFQSAIIIIIFAFLHDMKPAIG